MREKISDKLVRATEPTIGRMSTTIWDTEVVGFGLCITQAGARSFVLRYRIDNRERRLTIGSYPDWSVTAAREEAKAIKRLVDIGRDPLQERDDRRSAPTVADLAKRYLEEHASRKADHAYRDQKTMFSRLVLPGIGRMKVAEVKHADIDRLHREISKRTRIQANRVAQVLRKMFNLAIRWEYRTDNPVTGLVFNAEVPRNRYLSPEEIRRLTDVLAEHPNQRCANVIRLLLLTGARRGEAMNATWDQFDLENGIWTKPSSHTKQRREHRVPLSQAAVVLLKEIKAGQPRFCRFVFPGETPDHPLTEIKGFWDRVRIKAGIPDVHIHDLRHTYASILVSSGLSLPIIGALLGHTQTQTTARYSHLFDHPLREATERVSAVVIDFPGSKPGQNRAAG
ncbi:MAG: tyrosine-type recombinase/integrase [Rhodospirillales bacterium]|nr:tyrosine-type recombinase/integrase [Rhodospirillales bacterium]